MAPTLQVVLLWMGFGGSHLLLSNLPLRQRIVDRIGENAFRGMYSLLAFAWFIPLVWTYFAHKHTGPWLWMLPMGTGLRWIMYVGMGIAVVLLVSSFVQPSPASVVPGKPTPKGALRITRHPVLMSFAIFGLMHLPPNGSATDVAFFGGFVVFVLVGAWHQDQRKLATNMPGYHSFYEATPFIPFSGRETVQGIRELGPVIIGAGIAVTIIVRYFHASWFGG